MTVQRTRWTGLLLNAAILAFGLLLLVLLYAFFTRTFSSTSSGDADDVSVAPAGGDIVQVEILNGCGEAGVARIVGEHLRGRGFDILEMGNHTSFDEPHSYVIDRVDDRAAALRVARALGIDTARVTRDVRPEYHLDASVILGLDYASLTPFRNTAPDP